jgi:hypothetical protein
VISLKICENVYKGWLHRVNSITLSVTQLFVIWSYLALIGQKITIPGMATYFIAYHVFGFDILIKFYIQIFLNHLFSLRDRKIVYFVVYCN